MCVCVCAGNAMASVEDQEWDCLICSVDKLVLIIVMEYGDVHRFDITSVNTLTSFVNDSDCPFISIK